MASLKSPTGEDIAHRHSPGSGPGVIFCTGFKSDMGGGKALALEAWCRARGRQFTRFDYSGHGESTGRFEDGTIGRWREDALAVLDEVTTGPQLVVGSSMGGWIATLLALARPRRIVALLGIAAAPDFTRDIAARRLTPGQKQQLAEHGYCDMPNEYDDGQPYRIRQQLLDEARDHLLLGGVIPLHIPVRLLHGEQDADVPWDRSLALLRQIESDDAELCLVKDGDHRLSEPEDLRRMLRVLGDLLDGLG